jgi:hypothetical protein
MARNHQRKPQIIFKKNYLGTIEGFTFSVNAWVSAVWNISSACLPTMIHTRAHPGATAMAQPAPISNKSESVFFTSLHCFPNGLHPAASPVWAPKVLCQEAAAKSTQARKAEVSQDEIKVDHKAEASP